MRSLVRSLILGLGLAVAVGVEARAATVTVLPDRVLTDGPNREFVPRFVTYLPQVLVVPGGATVTLPADGTWDAIEVAGTLRCDRSRDTTARFTHLMILPGGSFDCGTEADPVLRTVRLIVRDVPIDTEKDPYQWGNGIVNFGRQTRVGRHVTPFTALTANAAAGTTTLSLRVPADWRVGDELFLPDTRQMGGGQRPRKESRVAVARIGDGVLTLTKPLDFEHLAIIDPDGATVLMPRVANLSRNIIVQSENADGVRGHTVEMGHQASWDIRGNFFDNLGRTRGVTLDSTTASPDGTITHVGTNQIAKYASHFHHAHALGSFFVDNVLVSAGVAKWANSIHGTHDAIVEDNIGIGFTGAAFVTEDGYEAYFSLKRNFAALSSGNNVGLAIDNIGRNCPGCEGAGFWLHSPIGTLEDNESWNNATGVDLFAMRPVLGTYPAGPGQPPTIKLQTRTARGVSMARNITASNTQTGWEHWDTAEFPVRDVVTAYNGVNQVRARGKTVLRNVTAVCADGRTLAFDSAAGYSPGTDVDGGRVVGCAAGFAGGGGIEFFRLRNLTLQNRININFDRGGPITPEPMVFENIRHVPLGTLPKRYIVWGTGKIWQPGEPMPAMVWRIWNPSRGPRALIVNWQGTGSNYRLYENQQKRGSPAYPANGSPGTEVFCPEAGLTAGECWDKYGLAYGGGVIAEKDALELEGITNGVVEPGLVTPLGTPRYVITSPNMQSPARTANRGATPALQVRGLLTGQPGDAAPYAYVALDDGRPMKIAKTAAQPLDDLSFVLKGDALKPGTHTLRTWRVRPNDVEIQGSHLTFSYYVGEPTPAHDSARARPAPDSTQDRTR